MTLTAPAPIETTTTSPLGSAVPVTRHPFQPSPLNQRRWQNFKANRRGYWSFWIFMVLFVLSLFADVLANDKPVVGLTKQNFQVFDDGERQEVVSMDFDEAPLDIMLLVDVSSSTGQVASEMEDQALRRCTT